MRNKRIALDVDDVLAAFTPHAHTFHGKELPNKLDYWSVPGMEERLGKGWFLDKLAQNNDFWKTIPVLSPATDIDFEIVCYISSFPIEMFHHRYKWLRDNGYPDAPLILASNKRDICTKLDIDILVDDKPETMKNLIGSGTRGIHFMTPYAGFEPVGEYITNLKQLKQWL